MKSTTSISIAAGLLMGFGMAANAKASITVQDLWHMGEDNNVLAADSVGGHNLTGSFSTSVNNTVHSPAIGSTSSIDNGSGGTYMANAGDAITVPTDNFMLELWVNFKSLNGGVNIASLGSDSTGNGWAKIGYSGNNFFFGRENESFGVLWDPAVNINQWYQLSYVQIDGHLHGYVDGVEATDLGFGDNAGSHNNSGLLHLGTKPGNSQNLDGYLDEVRFSTIAQGTFTTNDLLINAVPEPAPFLAVGLGALVLVRRRKRA